MVKSDQTPPPQKQKKKKKKKQKKLKIKKNFKLQTDIYHFTLYYRFIILDNTVIHVLV